MFNKDAAIKEFRRIYPEDFIQIFSVEEIGENYIFGVDFPDGTFYFVVTEYSVSSSYNSFDEAKRAI